MFVQVFQAKVRDADLWARRVATWRKEIRPKTTGFLGFTSGVTADGQMITVVRFKSAEAAKVDNDLPEQGAWFEETTKAFDGEVTFHDCEEVDEILGGGSDKAGYVQVMQGRAKDQEHMRSRARRSNPNSVKIRPDIIGGTARLARRRRRLHPGHVLHVGRRGAHERAGDGREPPLADFMAQIDGDLTFYDLTEPDFE